MTERVDVVVIGAGVIGLAIGAALTWAGREVMVLERADAWGQGVSSRNSEVVHAGLYYPHGSRKAALCVRGRELLYAYCGERGIPHAKCGKIIVATSGDEIGRLSALLDVGAANGVTGLRLLTRAEARDVEPEVECVAALLSPSTGIVDSHTLMLSLIGDLEAGGGILVERTAIERAAVMADGIGVRAVGSDGEVELVARTVVNAAGLDAVAFAKAGAGGERYSDFETVLAKGSYFTPTDKAPFSRLVYPVPELGGLGIHFTLDTGGGGRFGPDVEIVDAPDFYVDPRRVSAFEDSIRLYWPGLPDGGLQPGYAGIRPRVAIAGTVATDFLIEGPLAHGVTGLWHMLAVESPGLTSALAIAEHVAFAIALEQENRI
jgi:L-2-hydroxyglutarate oxidase LhgO